MCKPTAPLQRQRPLEPVTGIEQLDYLVKEAELLDQRPGRSFYVGRAHKRAWRIRIVPSGYHVQPWRHGRARHAVRTMARSDMQAELGRGLVYYAPIGHVSRCWRRA